MSNNWNNITFIMLGAIILVVAVPMALSDWYNVKGIWAHISDPAYFRLTEGRIISVSPYTSTGKSRNGYLSTLYHIAIEYEFIVDGRSYRSDKVNFDCDLAAAYRRHYTVGEIVTVYYDPNDPDFSVLEPENKGVLPVMFLIFLIVSTLVFALSSGYWLIGKAFFHKQSSHPGYSDEANSDGYEQVDRPHRDG